MSMQADEIQRSAPVEKAVATLNKVWNLSKNQVDVLEGDQRNVNIAQKVSDVFKLYKERLKALEEEVVKFGLTNRGHELVRNITRGVINTLTSLRNVVNDRSAALDRAEAAGADLYS